MCPSGWHSFTVHAYPCLALSFETPTSVPLLHRPLPEQAEKIKKQSHGELLMVLVMFVHNRVAQYVRERCTRRSWRRCLSLVGDIV